MLKPIEQFCFLAQDLKRWKIKSPKTLFYLAFELGIWATIFYRIGRALFLINIPIIKIFFRFICFFMFKFSEVVLGVALRPGTEIGPGLYIGHTGVTHFHPAVKIGKNFGIGNSVTIGVRGDGYHGAPIIGDNVGIHTGAKVLGGIRIGNNVKIGANAVVLSDIPDNATAVGVPAKVVKIRDGK